jgi:hypothetical protein
MHLTCCAHLLCTPHLLCSPAVLTCCAHHLQVHITYASPTAVFVTWVTNGTAPSVVSYGPKGSVASSWKSVSGPAGQVYSTLMDPRFPASEGGCIGSKNYTNPYCFYTSGEIHSVELTGLSPGTAYSYSVGGSGEAGKAASAAPQFSFKTAPAVGPGVALKLAVVGDLGQTENSSATVNAIKALVDHGDVDLVLHAGDLSYADGNGYRWDAYARMGQPLWSSVRAVAALLPTPTHPLSAWRV